VEDTGRAKAIMAASTAGPTAMGSGTTQVEKNAASSRTSTSSSGKQKGWRRDEVEIELGTVSSTLKFAEITVNAGAG